MSAKHWTVAYRKTRANRFLRVDDIALTWDEAFDLAGTCMAALGEGYDVWVTSTLKAEQDGYTCAEDRGNILTGTGRRVTIREGGVLPEGVTVAGHDVKKERPLGAAQKTVLNSLKRHGSYPGGFCYGCHSTTVRVLETLVKRGLVRKVAHEVANPMLSWTEYRLVEI